MKKIIIVLGLLLCVPMVAHAEGKFIKNTTNLGQFTDLQVKNGYTTTTKSGLKATIDLGSIAQADATLTTTPALAIYQAATTAPVFGITCTSGALSTCGSYTTTTATKAGSITIQINGTTRYIDFKNNPN